MTSTGYVRSPLNNASSLAKPPKPRSEDEIIAQWQGDGGKPLVSIQCITYNHAAYIEDAINGFLMQETTFPFEIWIHDDASTDGTREVIERYQTDYPRIIKTILQSENQYSKGVRAKYFLRGKCQGKYYALCEGDDYWLSPKKLQHQLEALKAYPEAHIAIHPAYMWDVKNSRSTKMYFKGKTTTLLDVSDAATSLGQFAPTASYLFKANEMEAMPNWFFEAKDLPFGDYFRETILGRNGLVYIPHFYSVYRRNIPVSFTARTQNSSPEDLLSRIESVLYYTNKLHDFDEIPKDAIKTRRQNIYKDYLNMALSRKSLTMYKNIIYLAQSNREKLPWYRFVAGYSISLFSLYRFVHRFLRLSNVALNIFKEKTK